MLSKYLYTNITNLFTDNTFYTRRVKAVKEQIKLNQRISEKNKLRINEKS